MTKWQYVSFIQRQDAATMAWLNGLGDDGWQVCHVEPITERPGWYQWLLQRPKPAALDLETKDGKGGRV